MLSPKRLAIFIPLFLFVSTLGAAEQGLSATYFSNDDFTGTLVSRIDPDIDFIWPAGTQPAPGIGPEWWSVIWTGAILVPATDTYQFSTLSDDGIVVIVDGQQIIWDWTGHAQTIDSGSIVLTKGPHKIEVRFYNGHLGATAQLSWSSSTIASQIIPSSSFEPMVPPAVLGHGTGLRGEYFSSSNFSGHPVEQIDPTVNFHWTGNLPSGSPADQAFSACWEGQIEPEYTDDYIFTINSSGGVALDLEGACLISGLKVNQPNGATATAHLQAGKRYDIRIRFIQFGMAPFIQFSWSSALTPAGIVPESQLYPMAARSEAAIRITSDLESLVSPAWIEGAVGSSESGLQGVLNGKPIQVVRDSDHDWYCRVDSTPFGVPIVPGENHLEIRSTADGRTCDARCAVNWQTTDLTALPYGLDPMVLRRNDALLLSATGAGAQLSIDPGDGRIPCRCAPGQALPIRFPTAGTFVVTGCIDGHIVGHLTVHVVDVDLQAPIACQIGYQRHKSVAIQAQKASDVLILSGDPLLMQVTQSGEASAGTADLKLLPYILGRPALEARIGGARGPMIARCPVDVFSMSTDADRSIPVIGTEPNGSVLVQGTLTMSPYVPALDVKLAIYAGGATFADGSLMEEMSTSGFQVDPLGVGTQTYELISSPNAYDCHTITIFQGSDQVGVVQ